MVVSCTNRPLENTGRNAALRYSRFTLLVEADDAWLEVKGGANVLSSGRHHCAESTTQRPSYVSKTVSWKTEGEWMGGVLSSVRGH